MPNVLTITTRTTVLTLSTSGGGGSGGSGGVTDHGALTGLGDDDHPQYLRANGSRALSGNLSVGDGVTIDGRDLSADGSKLDGVEPGATADQTAAEVPFTPVGSISATTVQDAIAEVASDAASALSSGLSTKADATALDAVAEDLDSHVQATAAVLPTSGEKAALAGTGTPSDSNRYVTSDDSRLTNSRAPTSHASSHATGGGDAITPASIGAVAVSTIEYVEDFALGRGYQHASDVHASAVRATQVVLHMPRASVEVARQLCGTQGQFGGGFSINISGEHYTARMYANGGSQRVATSACPPTTRRWNMVVARYNAEENGGADLSMRLDVNGGMVGSMYASSVGGTPTSGVAFFVGGRDGGVTAPALYDRIAGVGWVNRYVTDEELAAWFAACRAAGTLVDIPSGGGLSGGWRVSGGDPGASWVPFAGATALTRVGTAVTPGTDSSPLYK